MKKIPLSLPLLISLAFLTTASAELKQEYLLDDGQGLRSYTVACDELHCRPAEGTDHPLKIRQLDNATATATYATDQENRQAGRFELVLYETGKPRIERYRKSLSRRILALMDGKVAAQAIAQAATSTE
mgnify:CR=1 FL=1